MAAKWIEALTGSLEQKKQYKQDKARIEALPEPYGTAAKAGPDWCARVENTCVEFIGPPRVIR